MMLEVFSVNKVSVSGMRYNYLVHNYHRTMEDKIPLCTYRFIKHVLHLLAHFNLLAGALYSTSNLIVKAFLIVKVYNGFLECCNLQYLDLQLAFERNIFHHLSVKI